MSFFQENLLDIAQILKKMESKKIVDLSDDLKNLKKHFRKITNENLEI